MTKDLIDRMRALEADHDPDGWPSVQMRDISALCDAAQECGAGAGCCHLAARFATVRELAKQCAEWHLGDGDECGVIARELYEMVKD